jgi:hypothetical protein
MFIGALWLKVAISIDNGTSSPQDVASYSFSEESRMSLSYANDVDQRTEQIQAANNDDPQTDATIKDARKAYFTLAGSMVLNSHLRSLNAEACVEWNLHCPLCESLLGVWTCSQVGIKLSTDQTRLNRNLLLFGKSHYHKYHSNRFQKKENDNDETCRSMKSKAGQKRMRSASTSHRQSDTSPEDSDEDSIITDAEHYAELEFASSEESATDQSVKSQTSGKAHKH